LLQTISIPNPRVEGEFCADKGTAAGLPCDAGRQPLPHWVGLQQAQRANPLLICSFCSVPSVRAAEEHFYKAANSKLQ
jgi:hypothetical protein